MTSENIEQFLNRHASLNTECVQIRFKTRTALFGLFVKDNDYAYLKAKNFWRIVPQTKLDAFKSSNDLSLAKIYNGEEFTKLTTYKESFE